MNLPSLVGNYKFEIHGGELFDYFGASVEVGEFYNAVVDNLIIGAHRAHSCSLFK